jgi:hypothetical protein
MISDKPNLPAAASDTSAQKAETERTRQQREHGQSSSSSSTSSPKGMSSDAYRVRRKGTAIGASVTRILAFFVINDTWTISSSTVAAAAPAAAVADADVAELMRATSHRPFSQPPTVS